MQLTNIWRGKKALPRALAPIGSHIPNAGRVLIRGPDRTFLGFEAGAGPGDLHHGAVIGKSPVGERYLGAGPFQQGAGDEHAKAKAGAFAGRLIRAAAP